MQIAKVSALFLGVLFLSAHPLHAQSQPPCLEGRTKSGACIDATLGSLMRETVRVHTQPRLSYSGHPIAPSSDRRYDATRDWGQGLWRETRGACVLNFCP